MKFNFQINDPCDNIKILNNTNYDITYNCLKNCVNSQYYKYWFGFGPGKTLPNYCSVINCYQNYPRIWSPDCI